MADTTVVRSTTPGSGVGAWYPVALCRAQSGYDDAAPIPLHTDTTPLTLMRGFHTGKAASEFLTLASKF